MQAPTISPNGSRSVFLQSADSSWRMSSVFLSCGAVASSTAAGAGFYGFPRLFSGLSPRGCCQECPPARDDLLFLWHQQQQPQPVAGCLPSKLLRLLDHGCQHVESRGHWIQRWAIAGFPPGKLNVGAEQLRVGHEQLVHGCQQQRSLPAHECWSGACPLCGSSAMPRAESAFAGPRGHGTAGHRFGAISGPGRRQTGAERALCGRPGPGQGGECGFH
mmetsp:Transcript_30601/g.70590  ORF Transcript_30601/g.70590 Transcript_30601/m.70590 type:complete len:218 (-) Transcript_30601:1153-1806(-)